MDHVANKVREDGHSSEKLYAVAEKRKEELKVDKLKINELVETGVLTEDMETSGRVSEVLSKTKEDSGSGAASSTTKRQQFSATTIREQLLRSIPVQKVARRQIEREIKKEIKYLHRKAMRMLRSPREMNYFEMSNIARKIRELKAILLKLVKTSFDSLKTFWLRYVHGVM